LGTFSPSGKEEKVNIQFLSYEVGEGSREAG
jgi:hypothetical protein